MFVPYSYILDKEKIAERPVRPYDRAKLLLVDRANLSIKESVFSNLANELNENHVLVFNNTKVQPARLFGKIKGKEKEAEFLLVSKINDNTWHAMARPIKNLKDGAEVVIDQSLTARIIKRVSDQILEVEFKTNGSDLNESLRANLLMPIPPYIRQGQADKEDEKDYQTIFAKNEGSIAAPTASLHFTENLIKNIENKGVLIEFLTLHVGMASVRPLWDNNGDNNEIDKMRAPGEEFFIADPVLKQRLIEYKKKGKVIVAVGTTVVRALESLFVTDESLLNGNLAATELFIKPGFEFKIIDALVTNFHFPASSHLLLVEALIGAELLDKSYKFALENNFRFLSYGDGMFIS